MSQVYDAPSVLADTEYALSQEVSAFIADISNNSSAVSYAELFNIYKNTYEYFEMLQMENAAILEKTQQTTNSDITNDRMTYFYNQQLTSLQTSYSQVLQFYWLFLFIWVVICLNYQTFTNFGFLAVLFLFFLVYPFVMSMILQNAMGNFLA
jgi:hypothetical protein